MNKVFHAVSPSVMADIRVLLILDVNQRKVVTFSNGSNLQDLAATAYSD